jgi:hypothetical protein
MRLCELYLKTNQNTADRLFEVETVKECVSLRIRMFFLMSIAPFHDVFLDALTYAIAFIGLDDVDELRQLVGLAYELLMYLLLL